MKHIAKFAAGILFVSILGACTQQDANQSTNEPAIATSNETAEEFVARANAELAELRKETGAAEWVRSTYITDDTAIIASAASERRVEGRSTS